MSNNPLVSIVIPTYGRPEYLKRCVNSVLSQTYDNVEIFIVDDNNPNTQSRFETEKVMACFESNPKIKYIKHDKNRNGSAARNTGWRASSGKYITYLDDDDVIAPNKLQKQVECLEALDESWGACYTGYRLIKEHGENQISSEKRSGECYVDALMRTLFMGSGSNLLLRKSVVDEIGGYDESFTRNQDVEFLARALEHYKIAYIDEVLLTIYQEGNRAERTFEQLDGYAKHYLEKFDSRIQALDDKERERVIAVISLERCRVAFYKKKWLCGIRILKRNHVRFEYLIKYLEYLIYRHKTHESFGFDGL